MYLLLAIHRTEGGVSSNGNAVGQLVQALRYNPKGRGFDWNFLLVLGSTQPLTEMNTNNIAWGVKVTAAQG
jgi:hypothetical protein